MKSKIQLYYTTWPDMEIAKKIGKLLIDRNLAKCVNIIANSLSYYKWEGKTEHSSETIMIIKAPQNQACSIQETLQKLHPYDIPCFIAIEINKTDSNAKFLKWLEQ